MPDLYAILPDGKISNHQGQIAMRYRNAGHIRAFCTRDGASLFYDFIYRNNVSMAWVDPLDVPCLLAVKGGCCGKKSAGVIYPANELDVRYWTGLGR